MALWLGCLVTNLSLSYNYSVRSLCDGYKYEESRLPFNGNSTCVRLHIKRHYNHSDVSRAADPLSAVTPGLKVGPGLRRTEADKKFFNSISQRDSCLHHLLPLPRDTQLITKLRYANTYPVPLVKTKRFCSLINFGLANYVD